MLLKLNKLSLNKIAHGLLFGILMSVPLTINAAEYFDNKLQVHGFIAQGLIDVSGSDFVNNDQDLSTDLTEVGLNASYKINNDFRLAGQVVYLDGGNRYNQGSRVDYLLLDWSAYNNAAWQLNVYLGRFKNYNWLYSSTRDVPFTRPSIVLPQSVYFDGFRDIAVGGDGAAFRLRHNSDDLGEFDFNLSFGTSDISEEQTKIVLSKFATGDMHHDNDVQGSIFWRPLDSQWRFGAAFLDSEFTYNAGQNDMFQDAYIELNRIVFNSMYEGEKWEFSMEAFQEQFVMDNFYYQGFHQDNTGEGAFIQTRYKYNDKITLLARAEKFYRNKDDKNGNDFSKETNGAVPNYFGYQHDFTVGGSYDFNSRFRVQMEYHWVQGTARLTPVVLPNPQLNDEEYWQMWAVQLMYWF